MTHYASCSCSIMNSNWVLLLDIEHHQRNRFCVTLSCFILFLFISFFFPLKTPFILDFTLSSSLRYPHPRVKKTWVTRPKESTQTWNFGSVFWANVCASIRVCSVAASLDICWLDGWFRVATWACSCRTTERPQFIWQIEHISIDHKSNSIWNTTPSWNTLTIWFRHKD